MYRTVVIAALLLGGVVVAGAACGDDDDGGGEGHARRSTTTASSVEADVEAAYLAYWEMSVRVERSPDPEDPEITERTTGRALDAFVAGMERLRAQGQAIRHGPDYSHTVVSVEQADPMAAIVTDCFVDDAEIIDTLSDRVVSQATVTVLDRATLALADGDWRVSEIEQTTGWEGVAGCALEG